MSEMARVTGAEAGMATLSAPVLAEMAGLCNACPRTDACLRWLAAHTGGPGAPAPDWCPNHDVMTARAGVPPGA